METSRDVKSHVKERYGEIARTRGSCCSGAGCGCTVDTQALAERLGYSREDLERIPSRAFMGLGCGNPAGLADLRNGETVLDLGSGAGVDVFLTAMKIGENGKVIGVDMTPDMVKLATKNAEEGGFGNVEFRLGEIEKLPVEDSSVDAIISNCVINLSQDKPAVFAEAYRVLRVGGRILVSDIVTEGELPEDVRQDLDAWAGCIAGAMERGEYLSAIRRAGFTKVAVVGEHDCGDAGDPRLAGKITSIQIQAIK